MKNDNEIYDTVRQNKIKDVTRGSTVDLLVGYVIGFVFGLGIIKLISFFTS